MVRLRLAFALCLAVVFTFVTFAETKQDRQTYPATRRVDHTDDYHGTKVADPYRWLETDVRTSPEVAAWVAEENKVTDAYLKELPQREPMKKRLTELWNYERTNAPHLAGGKYYFTKNNGLQNQNVLYVSDTLNGSAKLLIDPNTWSKDGTIAMGATIYSDDGKYLAYGVQEAGSDWSHFKVLDLTTGKPLDDEVRWVKFSGAAWTKDGKGFFYSRYDEPKPGEKFQSLNMNQKVFYHKVGTPQSEDTLIYARPDQPTWSLAAAVTDDGKYLVITARKGTSAWHKVFVREVSATDAKPAELAGNFDYDYTLVANDGPWLYFRTDNAAPRGRIIAIDVNNPEPKNWKEIIPQSENALRGVNHVGNLLVCSYLKDAYTQVKEFDLKGKFIRDVKFPGIGTAMGFSGRPEDTETFYTFSSFATPPSIYRHDLKTGADTLVNVAKAQINSADYEVKQVFYPSKDGTKIPLFLTYKKGLKLDGNNPTLLYGYGGFNIPMTPSFSTARVAWLEQGGVLAVACMRGGGEYGKDWHMAGTRSQKQNVFDDFIAAAEYLCKENYTRPSRLAIQGGSNGGLLVGAVMCQRPDLFGACLPAVGVMDMLRFNKFTAGRFWTDDYGTPENPDDFKALYAYSPYHNLKEGTKYPATLVTTADTDDRVVPGHSFKFIAQLQHCQAGPAPVLARIETRAGHGAGKPTSKLIEEVADQYAFVMKALGMEMR